MAVASLAALDGAYPPLTLPLLALCVMAFFVTGASVAGAAHTRSLDLALVACLAVMLFQIVPLPGGVVALLSPQASALQSMLHLDRVRTWCPISVEPRLSRSGLATAASAVLLFWAAREAFARGGVRTTARTIAWTGLAMTLVALAQRATAPHLVLWRWTPRDPGSQPFGPFVNRNHFATWLVMAGALTSGYLVAHRRSHRIEHTSRRLLARDWLADGGGLILAASIGAMLLGLTASLSRAAILGAAAALVFALVVSPRRGPAGQSARLGIAALAILLAGFVWNSREGLERKFESAATVGRVVIWRETVPAIADFWMTGTGVGTYPRAMLRYQRTNPDLHFNQAHSEYVQLLAEGGLLLTLPAVLAVLAWIRVARLRMRREAHSLFWLRMGAAAGLLGVAVQGLFETGLRVPANALLCALLAAIVVHESRVTTPPPMDR